MSVRTRTIVLAAVASLLLPCVATGPVFAKTGALQALDPDKDGTVDLQEAQAAAEAKFAKLDPDNDGTLDAKELKGVLTAGELKAADPDGDGTVDKKEFLALVEARFKKADPDGDGTLDKKELNTKAGKALLHLLK